MCYLTSFFVALILCPLVAFSSARDSANGDYGIPCIYGENKPEGCSQRVRPWEELETNSLCQGKTLLDENSPQCENINEEDRIASHLTDDKKYCVKFDDKSGRKYGMIMYAGENWGAHPNTGSPYDCQGRCGADCQSSTYSWACSNWSNRCLTHDVCSWYFGSSGGLFDSNCGDEYFFAFFDWANCCLSAVCPAPCKGSGNPWKK